MIEKTIVCEKRLPRVMSAFELDPVQAGLVVSLNRPGGNVTGVNYMQAELVAKQLGLLHELLPSATRFAVLVNPNNPGVRTSAIVQLQEAASSIGAQMEVVRVSSNGELDDAFANLHKSASRRSWSALVNYLATAQILRRSRHDMRYLKCTMIASLLRSAGL